MEFNTILALPDKAVVPEVRGRVVKVYDPRNPTPGQDRAGIHPQTIVLQDDAGTNLDLYMMRKESHFLPSAVGEIYHFTCTPSDKDGSDIGMAMNRWKGERDEMVCVQVDRQAHFYAVEQAPAERKAYEDSKPVVGDLVTFYCNIITSVEERLHGSEVGGAFLNHPECLTSAAATIFIEGCKQGMYKKPPVTKPAGIDFKAATEKARAARMNAELAEGQAHLDAAQADALGAPKASYVTGTEVALMIASGFSKDTIKTALDSMQYVPDYAAIYDEIVPLLVNEGFSRKVIDAAHDRCRGLLKKNAPNLTDTQLYKSLCLNFSSFRKQLPVLPNKPEQTETDDGDGLPPLD